MKQVAKILILTLIEFNLGFFHPISAQDYRAIKTDASYYYYDSANKNIISIRIDSIKKTGDETFYYNFKQIRKTDSGCFTLLGASWLGDQVVEKQDGSFIFSKHPYPDNLPDSMHTFRILTRSGINQPWIFYWFHKSPDYIEANLKEIKWMSFLNLSDSVRIISLTRKNMAGQVIEDPLNTQKLLLSRNYGLIRLIKFDEIYYTINGFYDLVGKTNPETGITNLKTIQIYDFEPGDEFHTKYFARSYIPPHLITTVMTINRILEKIAYPSGDSVSYLIERCLSNCSTTSSDGTTCEHRFDTIRQTYTFLQTPEFEKEPCESVPKASLNEWATSTLMGFMQKDSRMPIMDVPMKYLRSGFWFSGDERCYSQIMIDGGYDAGYYFKGLGGPYYYSDDFGWGPSNLLLYYKKGTKKWGTPITCDSILQLATNQHQVQANLRIYPNPSNGNITVLIPVKLSFPCRLEISDLSGRIITEFSLNVQNQTLDIRELPSGIYLYRIVSSKGIIINGKFLRQ